MPKPLMRFKLFGQSAAQEKVGYPINVPLLIMIRT
jgi:hypothetical protein